MHGDLMIYDCFKATQKLINLGTEITKRFDGKICIIIAYKLDIIRIFCVDRKESFFMNIPREKLEHNFAQGYFAKFVSKEIKELMLVILDLKANEEIRKNLNR